MDYLFAFDLRTGRIAKNPNGANGGEYWIRYERLSHGIMVDVGDGLRHTIYVQSEIWDKLLKIIKDDFLIRADLEIIVNDWLVRGFPDEQSKAAFLSAVKQDLIPPVSVYLP